MTWINRPGGYWVAEAVPEAGHHARTDSWPLAGVSEVLIATDGVSSAVDDYDLFCWAEAVAVCRGKGPQAVVDFIHSAEQRDFDGRAWPRYKPHDDKALAYLVPLRTDG